MAWLRVFERCLPLLLSDKPRGWRERPPTQNASTHLCRWNLTSDTVFSVLLPTFVHARCVCGSNSVFGLTSTKKSFFLHKTKSRRPRKFTAKKAHFERLWSECLFIRFFVGNMRSAQKNTMWWWRHGGLLNIITHQGFPISTHKHQSGANFWRAL